jgi:hypothetical protein
LIRYEDLCVDPFGTTDILLKFLDLAPHKLIEKFIEQHTQTSRNAGASSNKITSSNIDTIIPSSKKVKSMQNPYGTVRNSNVTAFKWKKEMEEKYISVVQGACKTPMMMLGYNPMKNITENKYDDNFPIIIKSSKEIWPF